MSAMTLLWRYSITVLCTLFDDGVVQLEAPISDRLVRGELQMDPRPGTDETDTAGGIGGGGGTETA